MHVLLDDEEVRLKQSGQSTDDGAGGVSESLAEVLNKDHDRIVSTHYVSTCTLHAHNCPIQEAVQNTLGKGGLLTNSLLQFLHTMRSQE